MKLLWVILLCLVSFGVKGQVITTWLGGGIGGGLDGLGDGLHKDSAIIVDPTGIFFDNNGNFYCADQQGLRVRKVDTFEVITSICGTSIAGYNGDGGLADTSKLNGPGSVIADSIGNVYIADASNHRIRKIDVTTGLISTIAGTGVQGFSGDNGKAVNAQINLPGDICFDSYGNLLISDNSRIRKVDKAGIITTIAGNGSYASSVNGGLADTSAIGSSAGICTDNLNIYIYIYIYISDEHNYKIYKINNNNLITVIAGSGTGYSYNGDNMPATSVQIAPNRIRINPKTGNLFFVDNDHPASSRIRMIDSAGVVHTVAGNSTNTYSGDNGPATSAGIPYPSALGFDNCGNLYIAQLIGLVCIRKVTFDTSCHKHAQMGANTSSGIKNITTTDIKIYPNPTNHVLHIDVPITMQYKLMNMVGTVMQQGALQAGCNRVDVKRLESGIYMLEVSDGMQRMVSKVIKQ